MTEEYAKYLESSEWKAKRELVAKGRNNICEKCGKVVFINYQVHHLTYERIFNEELSDLLFLCGGCHYKIHNIKQTDEEKRAKRKIKKKRNREAAKFRSIEQKKQRRINSKLPPKEPVKWGTGGLLNLSEEQVDELYKRDIEVYKKDLSKYQKNLNKYEKQYLVKIK